MGCFKHNINASFYIFFTDRQNYFLGFREALSKGLGSGRKTRPILTQSNAVRKDSGAQTDISALPRSYWRSESSLANKVSFILTNNNLFDWNYFYF